jgi:hypothetical protein
MARIFSDRPATTEVVLLATVLPRRVGCVSYDTFSLIPVESVAALVIDTADDVGNDREQQEGGGWGRYR